MRRAWAMLSVLLLAGCAKPAAISEREAAMETMAAWLAKELRPPRVLVIGNPFTRISGRPAETYAFERAGLAGLKRGFGEAVQVRSVFPELRPEALESPGAIHIDPSSTTPLSFLVTEAAFQTLIDQNRDCELVISLIGLPLNMKALPAWSKPGPPRFALLLPDWRMIGGRGEIARAFSSGKLAAAIVRGPGAGQGFMLVTAENAAQTLDRHPQSFAP